MMFCSSSMVFGGGTFEVTSFLNACTQENDPKTLSLSCARPRVLGKRSPFY